MKLHQLKTFDAIISNGGIRAAARYLNVSSAAVTKAIKELETELGVPLINRHSSGVSLTEYGRALKVHTHSVLKQLERADSEIHAMRGEKASRLSVGITPWVALTFLPPTVVKFRSLMPEVKLEFYEGLTAVVQPLLLDGSLDFTIGRVLEDRVHTEFSSVPLFETQAAVVGRRNHPKQYCRSLKELEDAEWLLSWEPNEHTSMLEKLFSKHGMGIPKSIHFAHSVSVGLGLLTQTDMLGIYPWPLVETGLMREGLQALPLRETVSQSTVSLTFRQNMGLSTAAQCFLQCMKDVVEELSRSSNPHDKRLLNTLDVLF